jgi:hypothetical protein
MAVLMVPRLDPPGEEFPTLGPQVVDFMEDFLVFGPGDVRGQPYRLDDEKRAVIYRLYEVYPQDHPRAGRRRFKRGGLSVRKGWAKTELGAAIAACELHPDAPVRCDGFDAYGEPVGVGVSDPYIPMVAFTEEQSEELAYGALLVMLGEGPLADDFDLGVERVLVKGANGKAAGKAVALAAAPNSRDGARTTFQLFDETHRQDSDRLRHAHQTMLQNLPKRKAADAWSLEVTTSYEPGKDSIAERTHNYAKLIEKGEVEEPSLFFYHRYASDRHDLDTREGRVAAVLEASGPAAAHTDVDYVVGLSYDPDNDLAYWERVWLNREVASSSQVYSVTRFDELAEVGWKPSPGAPITLGFDGSRSRDWTGLVGTCVATGRQFVVGAWGVPRQKDGKPVPGYEIPGDEVDEVVAGAFRRWDVLRMKADPYWWESYVSAWVGRHGTVRIGKARQRRRHPRVFAFHTNVVRPMALAVRAHVNAIVSGECKNDGDKRLRAHIANARREDLSLLDEDGRPMFRMRKDRPDSPNAIDLAMAACLSWDAYRDVIGLGAEASGSSRTLHVY